MRAQDPELAPQPLDLGSVYRAHHDFIWRTLGMLGVASEGLDDATQDVFIVVHRRIADYDGRTPVRRWLLGDRPQSRAQIP